MTYGSEGCDIYKDGTVSGCPPRGGARVQTTGAGGDMFTSCYVANRADGATRVGPLSWPASWWPGSCRSASRWVRRTGCDPPAPRLLKLTGVKFSENSVIGQLPMSRASLENVILQNVINATNVQIGAAVHVAEQRVFLQVTRVSPDCVAKATLREVQ